MRMINEHITIAREPSLMKDMDYVLLRNLGQTYIEQLSRRYWTDYNISDPGITQLEVLCYAITDLGSRINQPIENVLAKKGGGEEDYFKTAKEILTCKPVTREDYRKLFIDLEGIRNVWLSAFDKSIHVACEPDNPRLNFLPYMDDTPQKELKIKGLYQLLVDYEDGVDKDIVKGEIMNRYHQNRNLCEDLVRIDDIGRYEIRICANIQLEAERDEELVWAQINWAIEQYFSPSIRQYSLAELQAKNIPTEDIFNGPILNNGFILTEELKAGELRKKVLLSDIIALIMDVEGVVAIAEITMGDDYNKETWEICIPENHRPVLKTNSVFKFKKGMLPVGVNAQRAEQLLVDIRKNHLQAAKRTYENLAFPKGEYVDKLGYATLQHDLPQNYGISANGLPTSTSNARKVKAKQLQAYLLFFDQVLANYFAQLDKVADLLSVNFNNSQTYFYQVVEGIKDIEDLIGDNTDYKTILAGILSGLQDDTQQKNKILDHLLSRFAESMTDYTSLMYKLYGKQRLGGTIGEEPVVEDKKRLLSQYEQVSSERGMAFNYRGEKVWDTTNISGFQKRIALLLGIDNYERRDLWNERLQIDTEIRADGTIEYRWQIHGDDGVLLSSRKDYTTKNGAIDNLLLALKLAYNPDNYRLAPTSTGNSQFIALFDNNDTMVGRQYNRYYTNVNTALVKKESVFTLIYEEILNNEGFYLVENILTLPYDQLMVDPTINQCLPICVTEKGCANCDDLDPFSYKVTIVFPGYGLRTSDIDFRRFAEQLIRRELPAHIVARICWVGHIEGALTEVVTIAENEGSVVELVKHEEDYDLKWFQQNWKAFLLSKNNVDNMWMAETNAIASLWCSMQQMNTIYPSGHLHDCRNDETEEVRQKIILNRSALGTL